MAEIKQRLLLGAHMSVAGGYYKAIERGVSIGCTTIQIFTKSNRQWYAKPINEQEINQFKQAKKQHNLHSIVSHAGYLINLASTNPDTLKKSISSLAQEIERCDLLEIPYLVLHPGGGENKKKGIYQVSVILDELLSKQSKKITILLETMAGQGNSLGSTFEELAEIYQAINHKTQVGFCVDTCHIFTAGYDMRTQETYHNTWHLFDTLLGLSKLKVIHVNDSKKELRSRIDRHEHIGKGKIGLEGFSLLFNDNRFIDVPKILETPKESIEEDLLNMQTIESVIQEKTRKKLIISIPK